MQEGLSVGKREGKAEAILELPREFGSVPDRMKERVMAEADLNVLNRWLRFVIHTKKIREFEEQMFSESTSQKTEV